MSTKYEVLDEDGPREGMLLVVRIHGVFFDHQNEHTASGKWGFTHPGIWEQLLNLNLGKHQYRTPYEWSKRYVCTTNYPNVHGNHGDHNVVESAWPFLVNLGYEKYTPIGPDCVCSICCTTGPLWLRHLWERAARMVFGEPTVKLALSIFKEEEEVVPF